MEQMADIPKSALAIAAHPDDLEFTCAGTLALWAEKGSRVAYVLCTSGDAGIEAPGITRLEAAKIREEEQRAAAKIIGVQEVIFLGEPDGLLQATLELRKKLVREIRRVRPEVVLCWDPTVFWIKDRMINHPDHRAAALAALDAVFPAAGQPLVFEDLAGEGLAPHKPQRLYMVGWDKADLFVDIEKTMDKKIEALKAHQSQWKGWDPEGFVRQMDGKRGREKGMAYAEAFRVFSLNDLPD
jgi:LmbE family N-acetylglucosaminyl deacetylase